MAELRGALKNKLNQLLKFDLLLIDELGYLPMNKHSTYNLFQLINVMYGSAYYFDHKQGFYTLGEVFVDDNVASLLLTV